MQIAVRPTCFVNMALNLVNPPQFAGRRDEWVDVHWAATQQLPQTDTSYFGNAHRMAWPDSRTRSIWIQQAGAMDLPIHPLVGSHKHADSAARKREKPVPEPDNDAATSSTPLHEHEDAILHVLLNLIHTNTTHQPCNGSLEKFKRRISPDVYAPGTHSGNNGRMRHERAHLHRVVSFSFVWRHCKAPRAAFQSRTT